jgi:hypothetical protein
MMAFGPSDRIKSWFERRFREYCRRLRHTLPNFRIGLLIFPVGEGEFVSANHDFPGSVDILVGRFASSVSRIALSLARDEFL